MPLRTSFENPKLLKTGLVVDSLVRGFIMEKMEEMDSKITGEITDHLFEKKGQRFTGLDLAALNIQRQMWTKFDITYLLLMVTRCSKRVIQ